MHCCRFLICLTFFFATDLFAQPNGDIKKSLVRISVTESDPDYKAPWNSGGIQRGLGAGFVIEGDRIMTNAHVVSNSRYVS